MSSQSSGGNVTTSLPGLHNRLGGVQFHRRANTPVSCATARRSQAPGAHDTIGLHVGESRPLMEQARAVRDIVQSLIQAYEDNRPVSLERLKNEAAKRHRLTSVPKLMDILAAVPPAYKDALAPKLRVKPVRSSSGIVIVAVMSKPHRCPHIYTTGSVCIYCPGGPDSAFPYSSQSYTGFEPTSMRAIRARYDPYVQVRSRVEQLQQLGHHADKVEFVLQGGTFMSLPADYRDWFIRNLHDALSGHGSASVAEAVRYGERSARLKCIGLTIETRPDYCQRSHLDAMLAYGCTRLEIGVQSVYEDIAVLTNRGHTVQAVADCFHVAKDAGYKIVAHLMPNLPDMDRERDVECFREFFDNPAFVARRQVPQHAAAGAGGSRGRVDVAGAALGAGVPGAARHPHAPGDQRRAVWQSARAGVGAHAGARSTVSRCAHARSGHPRDPPRGAAGAGGTSAAGHSGGSVAITSTLRRADVPVGAARRGGTERPGAALLDGAGAARVRHRVPVHERDPTLFQHRGFGTLLMEEAERIARDEHGSRKVAVISGVGTRGYYRKLGYALEGKRDAGVNKDGDRCLRWVKHSGHPSDGWRKKSRHADRPGRTPHVSDSCSGLRIGNRAACTHEAFSQCAGRRPATIALGRLLGRVGRVSLGIQRGEERRRENRPAGRRSAGAVRIGPTGGGAARGRVGTNDGRADWQVGIGVAPAGGGALLPERAWPQLQRDYIAMEWSREQVSALVLDVWIEGLLLGDALPGDDATRRHEWGIAHLDQVKRVLASAAEWLGEQRLAEMQRRVMHLQRDIERDTTDTHSTADGEATPASTATRHSPVSALMQRLRHDPDMAADVLCKLLDACRARRVRRIRVPLPRHLRGLRSSAAAPLTTHRDDDAPHLPPLLLAAHGGRGGNFIARLFQPPAGRLPGHVGGGAAGAAQSAAEEDAEAGGAGRAQGRQSRRTGSRCGTATTTTTGRGPTDPHRAGSATAAAAVVPVARRLRERGGGVDRPPGAGAGLGTQHPIREQEAGVFGSARRNRFSAVCAHRQAVHDRRGHHPVPRGIGTPVGHVARGRARQRRSGVARRLLVYHRAVAPRHRNDPHARVQPGRAADASPSGDPRPAHVQRAEDALHHHAVLPRALL
eukprot:ctg_1324.g418